MRWHKPKKTIKNITFILSLITMLISIFSIIIFLLWMNKPKLINKIDSNIPNYYFDEVSIILEKISTTQNSKLKLKYYKKLYKKLNNITSLDRFYPIKQETYDYLISYYKKEKNFKHALSLAKEWINQNDYDFRAKLQYGKVLEDISYSESSKYYSVLYMKHKDIIEIVKAYISFLVKGGELTKALNIELMFNKRYSNLVNAKYKLYYRDKQHAKYSEKSSIAINNVKNINTEIIDMKVSVALDAPSAIRFDINGASVGAIVEDINITIQVDNKVYSNINFKAKHHLKQLKDKSYKIMGMDPFYNIELPRTLRKYSGVIQFIITLSIKNKLDIARTALDEGN